MKTVLALIMLVALAGCGRKEAPPQFRLYGPSTGRDSSAWPNPPFNGDKHAWQLHERERAQRETEYRAR